MHRGLKSNREITNECRYRYFHYKSTFDKYYCNKLCVRLTITDPLLLQRSKWEVCCITMPGAEVTQSNRKPVSIPKRFSEEVKRI